VKKTQNSPAGVKSLSQAQAVLWLPLLEPACTLQLKPACNTRVLEHLLEPAAPLLGPQAGSLLRTACRQPWHSVALAPGAHCSGTDIRKGQFPIGLQVLPQNQ